MAMHAIRDRRGALRPFFLTAALCICGGLLGAGLSGCASEAAVNRDSPDFSAGYSDGCATSSARGGSTPSRKIRDEEAFRHNADYKAGWRTGYNACAVANDDRGGLGRY